MLIINLKSSFRVVHQVLVKDDLDYRRSSNLSVCQPVQILYLSWNSVQGHII